MWSKEHPRNSFARSLAADFREIFARAVWQVLSLRITEKMKWLRVGIQSVFQKQERRNHLCLFLVVMGSFLTIVFQNKSWFPKEMTAN
jgi:hypothetical protein